MQVDPIEFSSRAFNLYGYVSQDPFNFFDPTGLSKGSIRSPAAAGPASAEFNLLGEGAKIMREEAIQAVAEGAFNLLLNAMGQAQATIRRGKISAVRLEVHHCTPKSVGGSNKASNLSKIRRIRHMYVHKLMRVYMRPFRTSKARNSFIGIDPGRLFSKADIDVIAKQFYRDIDAILGVGAGC